MITVTEIIRVLAAPAPGGAAGGHLPVARRRLPAVPVPTARAEPPARDSDPDSEPDSDSETPAPDLSPGRLCTTE
jgi:hypothetical protein